MPHPVHAYLKWEIMGITGIHAIPMMITCMLQGTFCDTGIARTFCGEKICSVVLQIRVTTLSYTIEANRFSSGINKNGTQLSKWLKLSSLCYPSAPRSLGVSKKPRFLFKNFESSSYRSSFSGFSQKFWILGHNESKGCQKIKGFL